MAKRKKKQAFCKQDGFPLINIAGQQICVGEYVDRCIGGQAIVDVIQDGKTIYYVFANGHELPVLCFCCGKPLIYDNLRKARKDLCGRRLESMLWIEKRMKNGRRVIEFVLVFSKKWLLGRKTYAPVALKSAVLLRHPPRCSNQSRVPRENDSSKKMEGHPTQHKPDTAAP